MTSLLLGAMENYTLFIEIELLLSLKEIADLFQGNIIHNLPKLPDKFGAKHSNETGREHQQLVSFYALLRFELFTCRDTPHFGGRHRFKLGGHGVTGWPAFET